MVAHPGQVLGLGDDEAVLGVPVHELEHGAEGARALADRLAQRPQPRRVEMGVPDDADGVGTGGGRLVEQLVEHRLRPRASCRRCRAARGGCRRARGRRARRARLGLALGELGHQLDEDPEVVPEALELGVADVEVGRLQGEQGRAVGLGEQQRPRVGAERRRRVGGGLHEELDRLPGASPVGEQVLAVIRRQALDGPAVPPHQGLGPEPGGPGVADAEAEGDLAPCPLGRDGAAQPEPGGVPGRAPRPPEGEGRGSRPRTPRRRDRARRGRGGRRRPEGIAGPRRRGRTNSWRTRTIRPTRIESSGRTPTECTEEGSAVPARPQVGGGHPARFWPGPENRVNVDVVSDART